MSPALKATRTPLGLRLDIPAALDLVGEAVEAATAFVQSSVPVRDLFALRLTLSEAIANAIKHGRAKVGLEISLEAGRLTMVVSDHGAGFAWKDELEKAYDPRRQGGRGLKLLGVYGFNPTFNAKGNVLSLSKELKDL